MMCFQGDTVGRVKERMQERLGVNDKVVVSSITSHNTNYVIQFFIFSTLKEWDKYRVAFVLQGKPHYVEEDDKVINTKVAINPTA